MADEYKFGGDDGVFETGLLGCPPEKKAAKLAGEIEQDTFSGPLCVKDSRNYGQVERFHKNCRLFYLQCRLRGGGRGIRTPGTLSGTSVFKTDCFNRSHIPPRL